MKNIFYSLSLLFLSFNNFYGQSPVDIAENTLKVSALGEELFYYGFAEGDKLVFNFEELNGKELKELEIVEMPESSRFMDYKTKKIENKIININRTGIYKFRLSNSALGGRICKIKIQRIPSSDASKNFNSSVYWKTVYDTTYTPLEENYLIKTDTSAQTIVDQTAKISSQNAINGNSNKTIVDFTLPKGTISWSYYIGVGKEGKQEYNQASTNFFNAASKSVVRIPGYGAMAALAFQGINYFNKIKGEDNVKYWFISDWDNVLLFKNGSTFYQYKQGDVSNDASQMKSPKVGKVYLGLSNDNIAEPIDVIIKATAIVVTQQWGIRTIQKMNINSREVLYLKN